MILRQSAEFEWNLVPENSIVVDVGGGIGASAKFIADHVPHVRIIVQDKPKVVEAGVEACFRVYVLIVFC